MKKLFVMIAAAGLMLAGCTQNETEGYEVSDPNTISFSSSTSRAAISTLTTLTGDTGGFKLERIEGSAEAVLDELVVRFNMGGESNE